MDKDRAKEIFCDLVSRKEKPFVDVETLNALSDELTEAVSRDQKNTSDVCIGERVALAVASSNDDQLLDIARQFSDEDGEAGNAAVHYLTTAYTSLEVRRHLVASAIARLAVAGAATASK